MSTVLEVTNLVKSFGGVTAVNDVSLAVQTGEVFGIIGPNGAGKTTLFNLMTGFDRPDRGELRVLGRTMDKPSPEAIVRMGVARTFQNGEAFWGMTVMEQILIANLFGRTSNVLKDSLRSLPEESKRTAREFLRKFQIEDLADELIDSLPYGQQRLVEIVRAVATGARILMLDEPLAGLSMEAARQIEASIVELHQQGYTIVLIEHHLDVVTRVSSRIAVLDQGSLIAIGQPNEVTQNPAVIEAYVGRRRDADS